MAAAWARDLPQTVGEALIRLKEKLPELDAEWLVLHMLENLVSPGVNQKKISRSELGMLRSQALESNSSEWLLSALLRRLKGEPLQYITGLQYFLDHTYFVGPGVLIPRPETEVLVRLATEVLSKQFPEKGPALGFEIGTGSGAVSIELLSYFPTLKMHASELTETAMGFAKKNAENILGDLGANARFLLDFAKDRLDVWSVFENACEPSSLKADFLISNPPYLYLSDEAELAVRLSEPKEALFSPPEDPIYFYRKIANRAHEFIKPGGQVFLEVPHERALMIAGLFSDRGWASELHADLTGRHRVLIARQ